MEQHSILGEMQNGFHKGNRAPDNLFILCTLVETAPQNQKGKAIFAVFVDFQKAYN